MKRKLPLLTEQSFATLRHTRIQLATEFETQTKLQVQEAGGKISCKSGCANCCYHPVLITAIEGVLLYRWLASHGRWTPSLRASLKEHADKTRDLNHSVWFLSAIPCPLLGKDAMCSAYEGRPFQCRATFSFGNPGDCHPHRIDDAKLVDRQEAMAKYHSIQAKIAKKHGLQMVILPLSAAILLGERISSGELDLEEADLEVLRTLVEA